MKPTVWPPQAGMTTTNKATELPSCLFHRREHRVQRDPQKALCLHVFVVQKVLSPVELVICNKPKEKPDLLVEAQRIGKKTAAKLIAGSPKLGGCAAKNTKRYSCCKGGYHFINGSRPYIRSIIYMVPLTATRWTPIIFDKYQRLLKAGKKKVAIMVCMLTDGAITLQ